MRWIRPEASAISRTDVVPSFRAAATVARNSQRRTPVLIMASTPQAGQRGEKAITSSRLALTPSRQPSGPKQGLVKTNRRHAESRARRAVGFELPGGGSERSRSFSKADLGIKPSSAPRPRHLCLCLEERAAASLRLRPVLLQSDGTSNRLRCGGPAHGGWLLALNRL